MSKRTGMPKARKMQILMGILMDNEQPYTLKEMEKMGSKQKVVSQSIKDVLQELVDDGLVHLEKIGISNYYWAFPSEANENKRKKLASLESSIAAKKQKVKENDEVISSLSAGRELTEEYVALRNEHQENLSVLKEVEQKLSTLAKNDPEALKELSNFVVEAKAGANLWTDNMYAIKSYLEKKHGMSRRQTAETLGMKGDFDYVE